MPLVIEESFLPATLTASPMTDEEFAKFCAKYPDYFIEMTAQGELLIMPPSYSLTGAQTGEIGSQLNDWARKHRNGIVTDGISGFVLPSGARRSPDAAWTAKARLEKMDAAAIRSYWHLCPDFVIELRSRTDRLRPLRAKMREWIANGAQLAWLIDPERRAIEIYRPDREPETSENALRVTGEGQLQGFVLNLALVWDPLSL
ncbi:MAG: Uma2 family endonuclease [Bryobacteraceae bacterium]